jgi:nucleotide-binding universal stress UspA family protein
VSSVRRIIVGASGSPGSLRALRYAQHLARDLDAALVPVLAWLPPDGDMADRRTPCEELRGIWARDARQRLQDALTLAWGDLPTDLPVRPVIRRGQPGLVLVEAACRPGDLLVAGAGRRGVLARIAGGRVSRYCLAHARCPVLTVPPPPLARETRRTAPTRAFRHRTLTAPDRLSPDKRDGRLADTHPQEP